MSWLRKLKELAKGAPPIQRLVLERGARKVERLYAETSDYYHNLTCQRNLKWDCEEMARQVADRPAMQDRARKPNGQIHTFFIDDNGDYTLTHMVPALQRAGRCSLVDWETIAGTSPLHSRKWQGDDPGIIGGLIGQIEEAGAAQPVDLIFCACGIGTLGNAAVERLSKLRIPMVSYWADDKQNFWQHMGGERGKVPQAALMDLCWTTSDACVPWYIAEGGRAISLPEGADPGTFHVGLCDDFQHEVSFIGKKYGRRADFIGYLKKRGIEVSVFGTGWGAPRLKWRDMALTFAKSRITLGFAGTGHSPRIPTLKGRDFEAPMAGGLYLTAFSEELARHYRVNDEVVCYTSPEECVDVIRYLLSRPELCHAIRKRGQERALRDHTWDARFLKLMSFMALAEEVPEQS